MRPDHYLCLALTPAVQAALLFAALPTARGAAPERIFAILALVIPLAIYVWGLRDAPIAPPTARRGVRFALLGLVATGLAFGGFLFGLEFITSELATR